MSTDIHNDKQFFRDLKNVLGFSPKNKHLYKLVFTHKSAAKEINPGHKNSNERLEFLGDAILGAVVAEILFKNYPFKDEGFLTKTRSKIVNRKFLNELSQKLGLEKFLLYDKSALGHVGISHAMHGDAFEALLGAIFVERGFKFTRNFIIKRIVNPHVDIEDLILNEVNHKSLLIEWCQKENKKIRFDMIEELMEEKIRKFKMGVWIDGELKAEAVALNKKAAEKRAAERLCEELHVPLI